MAKSFADLDAEFFASLDKEAGLSALDSESLPRISFPTSDPNKPLDFVENTIPTIDTPEIADPQGISAPKIRPDILPMKPLDEVLSHGIKGAGNLMVDWISSLAKQEAEVGGKVRTWMWNKIGLQKPEYLKSMDKALGEWGDKMKFALNQYIEQHPEEQKRIPENAGFWETLSVYTTRPDVLGQAILENSPLLAIGGAGHIIGGVVAGVGVSITLMGIPLSADSYTEARKEGTEVLPAFMQSVLTGYGEAAIEEWTLGKKIGLAQTIGKVKGLPRALWEGTKLFFRGMAEEGSQRFNRNFWNWIWTDRSQKLFEDVLTEAAAGGPLELAMGGGFAAAGKVAQTVTTEKKLKRVDQFREILESSELTEPQKQEVRTELDKAGQFAQEGEQAGRFVRRELGGVKAAETKVAKEEVADIPEGTLDQKVFDKVSRPAPETERVTTFPREIQVEPQPIEQVGFPPEAVAGQTPVTEAVAEPQAPDIVNPKIHIGNVTQGMKRRIEEGTGLLAEDIQGFKEGAFPTKKTQIPMTRPEAEATLIFIENSLQEKVDNDLIRTENGLLQANIDWADIKALREVLDKPIGARPFREVNISKMTNEQVDVIAADLDIDIPTTTEVAGQQVNLTQSQVRELQERAVTDIRRGKMFVEPISPKAPTKQRVAQAVKPTIESGMTTQQVLDSVMKKAEISSAKAWLESAKKIVADHKSLAAFIKEDFKDTGITVAEQNRLRSIVARARTDKQRIQAVAAVQMLQFRAEHRNKVNEVKDFMKKVRKAKRFGKVDLGRLPKAVRPQIKAFFDTFDFTQMSEKKFQELLEREELFTKLAGNIADLGSRNLSTEEISSVMPTISQAKINELNRLRKIPLKNLDITELDYIKTTIEQLIAEGDKDFLEGKVKQAELENAKKTEATGEIAQKSKEKGVTVDVLGIVGFGKKLLTTQQWTLRTLSSAITGKKTSATDFFIQDNLKKYEEGKARISRIFTEGARKIFIKELGWTKADSKRLRQRRTIRIGGKDVSLTFDNILSIYQHIKADGNLGQLLQTDGLVIIETERDIKSLFTIKKRIATETGTPTDTELRKIVQLVEAQPKFKEYSEAVFKFNREVASPEVNKTSNKIQNFPLNTEKRHHRIVRVFNKKVVDRPTELSKTLEEESRRQAKTGGTARIRIVPLQAELMSSMQSDAAYAGGAIAIRDLRVLVNSNRWQKRMREAGRADELDKIVKMVNRIQAFSNDASVVDLFLAEALNNFGKSVLSLRLTGYGIQTASIPAAYETIESKYFLRARPLISAAQIPRAGLQEMKSLSDILWMRWEGRKFNYVTGAVAAQHAFDTMVLQDSPITDKALNQYLWGDQKAIYTIYLAAQEKAAVEQGLRRGSKANKEAAIKLTEEALDTQPQWDVIHRSVLTSSPEVPLRGSTLFMSARLAQFNVGSRAIIDRAKGRIGTLKMLERLGGLAFANVLVAVVRGLVALGVTSATAALIWAGGDEEKAKRIVFETAKKRALRAPLDSILNMISLPALLGPFAQNIANEVIKRLRTSGLPLRDLQSIRTGNIFVDMSLDVTDLFGSFGKMLQFMESGEVFKSGPDKGLLKWKRERDRFALALAELIALRNGLPFSAPRGEIGFRVKQLTKKDSKGARSGTQTTFRRRSTSTSGQRTIFRKGTP